VAQESGSHHQKRGFNFMKINNFFKVKGILTELVVSTTRISIRNDFYIGVFVGGSEELSSEQAASSGFNYSI
jgi:hypothetical protein